MDIVAVVKLFCQACRSVGNKCRDGANRPNKGSEYDDKDGRDERARKFGHACSVVGPAYDTSKLGGRIQEYHFQDRKRLVGCCRLSSRSRCGRQEDPKTKTFSDDVGLSSSLLLLYIY